MLKKIEKTGLFPEAVAQKRRWWKSDKYTFFSPLPFSSLLPVCVLLLFSSPQGVFWEVLEQFFFSHTEKHDMHLTWNALFKVRKEYADHDTTHNIHRRECILKSNLLNDDSSQPHLVVKFLIVMSLEDSLTIFVTLRIESRDKLQSFFFGGGWEGKVYGGRKSGDILIGNFSQLCIHVKLRHKKAGVT